MNCLCNVQIKRNDALASHQISLEISPIITAGFELNYCTEI
jgi:hypothetical protein